MTTEPNPAPFMGILMLDTVFPRIPGDIGNPATFDFPIQYKKVSGATPDRVVKHPDPGLINPFVQAGQALIQSGAKALSTSCGFLALFHRELNAALDVPVFTSSLLQVPLAATLLKPGQKVGIITARKKSLTPAHLEAVGINDIPLAVQGMEEAPEFTEVFIRGNTVLDREQCRKEMAAAAQTLITTHPETGPIVLECTNMPPYSDTIRHTTGRPVFDVTTLLSTAWNIL